MYVIMVRKYGDTRWRVLPINADECENGPEPFKLRINALHIARNFKERRPNADYMVVELGPEVTR